MANIDGVHSVGDSLMQYLENTYPAVLREAHPCEFRLVSSNQLAGEIDFGTSVTLYLYRVIVNEFLRNTPIIENGRHSQPPLSVDLHYLLSVWADSAVAEHTICAWVMQELNRHPIMDLSSLTPEGGWDATEVVHIVPAELSNEDLMRIWDALAPNYRLSLSYVARAVRIEVEEDDEGGEAVVATRFAYSNGVAANGS